MKKICAVLSRDAMFAQAAQLKEAGNVLARAKNYQEALAKYEAALQLNPRLTAALFNKGTMQKRLGQLEDALVTFEQVLIKDPGHIKAVYNKALVLESLGREREALPAFARALELQPANQTMQGAKKRCGQKVPAFIYLGIADLKLIPEAEDTTVKTTVKILELGRGKHSGDVGHMALTGQYIYPGQNKTQNIT